jgi:hypothetical protein
MSKPLRFGVIRRPVLIDDIEDLVQILNMLVLTFMLGILVATGVIGVWTQIVPMLFP